MKRVLAIFVVTALGAALIPFTPVLGRYAPPASNPKANAKFVPDEVIVQFRAGVNPDEQSIALNFAASSLKERLRAAGGAAGALGVARIQAGIPVEAAIRLLKSHPAVEFAEKNFIYTRQATSNDPAYENESLWGMYGDATTPANEFGSQAGEAWANDHTGSNTVYVGVIDDGIDFNHPDLDDNIWVNPFDLVDGLDNDGNGYVDDIRGWDFNENNNSIYDGTPGDNIDAHGTHVSGTIGGEGNNGIGVAGVNWDVTIISGKFLGAGVGTTADAIKALDYFTDLKNRHGLNIVATNNSWGDGGYSQALHAAIIRGAKADILFVAAAGNAYSDNDVVESYPANYDTTQAAGSETAAGYDAVIAVTSIDSYGSSSECYDCDYATEAGGYSIGPNYGASTVDLGAPGTNVVSTTPNNTYSFLSGTSTAAAHVSGAAALYRSINPNSSASDVKNAILDQTTLTSSLVGITVTGGRLNVGNFGLPPPNPPADPSALTATAVSANQTPSQVNLAWTDNSDNEDSFKIERCEGAGCANFTQIARLVANTTTFSNIYLPAGTTYRYRVRASNSGGSSDFSNEAEATTLAPSPPAAPSNLAATAISSTQINLSWTDNADNEDGVKIERCTGAGCTNFALLLHSGGTNVTSFSNAQLFASTTYSYRVRATNPQGDSGYSNVAEATTKVSPFPPAAPANLLASRGSSKGSINLGWVDNSSDEIGIRLYRCAGNNCTPTTEITTIAANVTTYTDVGLALGKTYRYRVRAYNSAGNSAYSNIASAKLP